MGKSREGGLSDTKNCGQSGTGHFITRRINLPDRGSVIDQVPSGIKSWIRRIQTGGDFNKVRIAIRIGIGQDGAGSMLIYFRPVG